MTNENNGDVVNQTDTTETQNDAFTVAIHQEFSDLDPQNINTPSTDMIPDLKDRLLRIAKGAGLMTDVKISYRIRHGVDNLVVNYTLSDIVQQIFEEVGAPPFDEIDFSLASDFFEKTFPENWKNTTKEQLLKNYSETEIHEILSKPLDTHVSPILINEIGSSDVGDVSYVVPTCWLSVACWTIGTSFHSWQATSQGATSITHKGILKAGEVIANACIRLMKEQDIVTKAQAELEKKAGRVYVSTIPLDLDLQHQSEFTVL